MRSPNLQAGPFSDWALTAPFYSALHLIDAYVAGTLNQHPRNHTVRNHAVRSTAAPRAAYSHYRELQERSRDARYECITFRAQDVQLLRQSDFEPLRHRLHRLLRLTV